MSEPILVLNCGSSSIKFALFDAIVQPLPRKPTWASQIDGHHDNECRDARRIQTEH